MAGLYFIAPSGPHHLSLYLAGAGEADQVAGNRVSAPSDGHIGVPSEESDMFGKREGCKNSLVILYKKDTLNDNGFMGCLAFLLKNADFQMKLHVNYQRDISRDFFLGLLTDTQYCHHFAHQTTPE